MNNPKVYEEDYSLAEAQRKVTKVKLVRRRQREVLARLVRLRVVSFRAYVQCKKNITDCDALLKQMGVV